MPSHEPSTELMLAALAPASDRARARLHAAVTAGVDWDRVPAALATHRLGPLLYDRLRAAGQLDRVPAGVRAHLESLYRSSAVRAARLQATVQDLIGTFAAAGLAAIPVRGPALAAQLGLDPATRQCDDLDFLLPQADLAPARAALLAAGYVPVNSPPTPAALRHAIRAGGAHVLQQPGTSFQVDLAWSLLPGYFASPITHDDLRPSLHAFMLGGTPTAVLNRELLLVALCMHGAKHLWSRHAWTRDVVELLAAADNLDWSAAQAHARRLGAGRMLRLGIAWAARASGVSVPEAWRAAIASDTGVQRLCDELDAHFDSNPEWIPADDWERARFHLRSQDHVRGRARYLLRRAFTPSPNDWRARQLPVAAFPLYALLRPLRLARRAWRRGGA